MVTKPYWVIDGCSVLSTGKCYPLSEQLETDFS